MSKTFKAATIVVYGTIPIIGKRRGAVVFNGNKQPKDAWLRVNGKEYETTNWSYQIRTYVLGAAQYTTVGTDYQAAEIMLIRMQQSHTAQILKERLNIDLPQPKKTLREFLAAFKLKKSKLGVDSVALYDTLEVFVRTTGVAYPDEIKSQHVVDYYDALSDDGYAQRTCQTRYIAIRGFLRWCGLNLNEVIDEDDHRRLRKKPEPKTEPYSQAETDKLMAVADDYYRVVFMLLLTAGLRKGEAMHLTWNQVKWDENYLDIRDKMEIHHPRHRGKVIKFKTKTGKGRRVPLFASLKELLVEWRKQNPNTVFVVGTRSDLPDGHWLEYLNGYGKKAGINCGICETCASKGECEEVYIHKFRHTYAHRCLEKFTIHQVSKWMGHSSIAVTAIYLSGTPKDADIDPFEESTPVASAKGKVLEFASA